MRQNRRRSVQASKLQAQLIQAQQNAKKSENSITVRSPSPVASIEAVPVPPMQVQKSMKKSSSPPVVPPFKPIPPAEERPAINSQSSSSSSIPQPAITGIAIPTFSPTADVIKMKATAKTTTMSTTHRPTSKYANSVGKVMNAPKEYYPVGYDKILTIILPPRVELPDTSFYCGDQEALPGVVFHVCALTDDGLIMKSFLCPESTLFDQTILKCNWWFYVDCKNSKKLYDSNIPISKSYRIDEDFNLLLRVQEGRGVSHAQNEGQRLIILINT
ncbi:hypothetical protein NQ318_001739 [Aromia moschata]|uniref:Chitin-binding type-2 domain-containing protein n=1 Tax=Aromia moschata TaxID=1265417 RepID=A0AAV8XSQ9_9CUCU|nr:hypothetical protein NQ318_001739 [Aromia moschata]